MIVSSPRFWDCVPARTRTHTHTHTHKHARTHSCGRFYGHVQPCTRAGDPLLALPIFYVPLLNVGVSVKYMMPSGRDAQDHHIYPRVSDLSQLENSPPQVSMCTWACAPACTLSWCV